MSENRNNYLREKVYLAALLHDIGKFYQRFDPDNSKNSKILKDDIKNLESTYCPKSNNYYSHKHVLWTAQFFDNHRKKLNKIFGLEPNSDELMTLSASHHNPIQGNNLAFIVQLADKLSSAVEREEKKQISNDEHTGVDSFKKVPLKSIFDLVSLNGNYPESATHPIQTQPLSIEELPNAQDLDYKPDYSLWEKFENEFENISDNLSPDNFIQTLDALLHKYTYCIPSSTVDEPDISLYDHLKTTSFLAISLYDYMVSNDLSFNRINEDCEPFILLGGDISGIQDFIYNIPSKGAAKQLKGRSFYIHLLTEVIVRYILREYKLLNINIVYSSGGNFYLLLPNLKNTPDKISTLTSSINEKLLKKFGTDIYLALEYNKISISNLKQKESGTDIKLLSEIWDDLISNKLHKAKNQRYLTSLSKNYSHFFEPFLPSANNSIDKELEELGQKLKTSAYIVFSTKKINGQTCFCDLDLGIYTYLLRSSVDNIENSEIIRLNSTSFIEGTQDKNNTYRFDFYGGNDFPSDDLGQPKTFEELAEGDNLSRLGIVRMDVDNLGKIFAEGFDPRIRTFSRLTSLSRNLDFFFKGFINTIWKNNKGLREYTYILYSGGDDLFLIGRWDKALEFALENKKAFSSFTNSEVFGLSGGLSIEKPKYPIRRAAFNAGIAEKKAKDFEINIDNGHSTLKKNAFTLFNTPISWKYNFESVINLKDEIKNIMVLSGLSHSFFNYLKIFYKMQKVSYVDMKNDESPKCENASIKWRWLAAYQLQRTKERISKNNEYLRKFIDDLKISMFTNRFALGGKNEVISSNTNFLELLAIAIRWAELELRTDKSLHNKETSF